MPYLRPPLFVRNVFNPIAMRFGLGGSEALEVTRRRSGGVQRVPVIPVTVEGVDYLVCPRGETQWVRNLRAAGRCRVGRHGRERDYTAVEVPVAERGPISVAYKAKAGRAVKSLYERLPDDKDHPVFRLTPA
ncbi:MAG: nitroreductase family deazaflavin-dependent oxidoreductase [Thermoleophilia bacterium]|nr:nitroreductase family deazaflavin-dependent oxidoreductase [Thermoleophilia bacterium]